MQRCGEEVGWGALYLLKSHPFYFLVCLAFSCAPSRLPPKSLLAQPAHDIDLSLSLGCSDANHHTKPHADQVCLGGPPTPSHPAPLLAGMLLATPV